MPSDMPTSFPFGVFLVSGNIDNPTIEDTMADLVAHNIDLAVFDGTGASSGPARLIAAGNAGVDVAYSFASDLWTAVTGYWQAGVADTIQNARGAV